MNIRQWLEIGELVCLVLFGVGAIAAGLSGQWLYGFIPLFLSLSLNWLNRQQVRRIQIRQSESLQRLAHTLTQVESAWRAAPAPPNSRVDLDSLVSAIEQLYQHQQALEQILAPMRTQLEMLTEQFRHRPELTQIESLTAIIRDLQKLLNRLSQE